MILEMIYNLLDLCWIFLVLQIYNSSTNALKKTNTYGYDTTKKEKLTSYVVRVCGAKIKEACESLSDTIANSIDRAKTKPKSQKKKSITLLLKKLLVHLILENFYKRQT